MDATIVGKDGKMYSSKNALLTPTGDAVAKHHKRSYPKQGKQYRATVVVVQGGELLLVRDKGSRDFSMPGGGFRHDESTVQAGIREVNEEVGGLTVVGAERLRFCDFEGQRAKHKVCRITVEGSPYIHQHHEIDKVIWWDMESPLPVQGHVKYILSKIKEMQQREKLYTRISAQG